MFLLGHETSFPCYNVRRYSKLGVTAQNKKLRECFSCETAPKRFEDIWPMNHETDCGLQPSTSAADPKEEESHVLLFLTDDGLLETLVCGYQTELALAMSHAGGGWP